MSRFWAEKIRASKLPMIFIILAACSPKPSPVPPGPIETDAGVCGARFITACQNAVEHGLGAAYPGGCTATAAQEHCK
jgi:hypothetical protein